MTMIEPGDLRSPVPAAVLMVVGCLALIITTFVIADKRQFLASAQRAPGVVERLSAGNAHPNIRFTSPQGRSIAFPEGGWISARKGQQVQVLFLAEDPERTACLDDPGAIWFGPSMLGGLGLLQLLGGGIALVIRRRRAQAT